ncbi:MULTISPECIES: hypothetical protein [unclassified Nostoc]|uniref:hypothetical protein n=1 Tax=unclassified Nostoc TaxID=2593658 RepID=UPI002AD207FA|nr:hypothetical protein [Nostoc sp. DedQUE03]MDZ7975538.1 hypothetical protein [Nostoc sp. DedQUE03]MDZ8045592.1 hypothetical protein [Nostoc sp. DedQUE02]
MTQIVGTLKDSAGNGITGKLIVVLAGTLIDEATSPDTIYLPQSYTFSITAGAVDITLPQSETSRITYNFQFFKTATDGSLIEPALINFNALVPNVSPVQFASLVPTGLVNDVLDTGALRVARLISSTPALAQSIGGPFPQGAYSPTTTYKFRDLVTYLNRTYISKDLNPIKGVAPTNTTSWMVIPVEPNGSLILADDTPYSSAWNGSGKSASQDAVYDQVEDVKSNVALKANLISPIFSGDVIAPTTVVNDKSTKVATTSFVSSQTDRYFKVIRTIDITNSSDYVIAWSALDYSANCNFVSTYFEVPESGIYLFGGSIYFTNIDTGTRTFGAFLQLNGSDTLRICEANFAAAVGGCVPMNPIQMRLLAGQQIRIRTTNFGGTNLYKIVGDPSVTNWWGQKVASL